MSADRCIYCARPRREHDAEGNCSQWAYADNILDNLKSFGEQGTRWDICLRCGNARLVGSLDELCSRCRRAQPEAGDAQVAHAGNEESPHPAGWGL